jgi:sodium-dependent phosphate transporter
LVLKSLTFGHFWGGRAGLAMWEEFRWLLVAGGIGAFATAMGTGANDVANSFATSVGSKALTLAQAMILASIFEFLGAVLLGGAVTRTIATGVVELSCFDAQPDVFMYGMSCTVWATGFWLLVASYLELPVSTTHSTIGGLVGFSLTYGGRECVKWWERDNEFPYREGVGLIVIGWAVSPIITSLLAGGLFFAVRSCILRHKNAFKRAMYIFPMLVVATIFLNVFFVAYMAPETALSPTVALIWAAGLSILSGLVAVALLPRMQKRVQSRVRRLPLKPSGQGSQMFQSAYDDDDGPCVRRATLHSIPLEHSPPLSPVVEGEVNCGDNLKCISQALNGLGEGTKEALQATNLGIFVLSQLDRDLEFEAQQSALVKQIHASAESFDPKAESFFSFAQVFTAIADAFAHGSNDVSNAIGPFVAAYTVYQYGTIDSLNDDDIAVEWILVMGGTGIVLGLLLFGYILMRALGFKLAKITPARGFIVELSSAVVVLVGTSLHLPVSTTHCQVGAIFGIGILEGQSGVNWLALAKILMGWMLTMVVCGLTTAALFAQGAYSPSAYCEPPT